MGKGGIKMLTNIIIQGIVAFIAIVFLCVAINFWEVRPKSKIPLLRDSKKCKTLAITFGIAAILMVGYFCYDVCCLNYINVFTCGIKIFFLGIAVTLFICSTLEGWKWYKFHGGYSLTVIACLIMLFVPMLEMDYESEMLRQYNENVIKQMEPKVETYECQLLAANYASKTEGSINGNMQNITTSGFFVQRTNVTGNINGQIQQIDVYKFYYVASKTTGEIRLMTLNANTTPIFFVEDGEQPYLLKRISTPYSLDYNIDPPKECNFGKPTVEYELHIPKNSILENFEFNTNS